MMKPVVTRTLIALALICGSAKALDFTPKLSPDAQKLHRPLAANDQPNPFGDTKADTSRVRGAVTTSSTQTTGKSMWKAVLLSAAVPGGGEYYLGKKKRARVFFATEALTWLGFASFKVYGHWKKDDYIRYAGINANAQLDGKSDEFADLVGFYDDIDQYNSLGRVSDPQRPYLFDTPENHWRWQTNDAKINYRTIKNQSREAFRRAKFMVGIAAVARLISMVDAVLIARQTNRQVDTKFSQVDPPVEFRIDPASQTRQLSLVIHTNW